MAAKKYPNLFKNRYQGLKGKAWLRDTDPEDRKAFAMIGLAESDYGRAGGLAVVKKYGRDHMAAIGRMGAAVTNRLHQINAHLAAIEAEGEEVLT
jgi:hypothetical protein